MNKVSDAVPLLRILVAGWEGGGNVPPSSPRCARWRPAVTTFG
jgi:hypothetical protein